MKVHKVKAGEDMITIAQEYHIADWEALYNHTLNERLRKYRPNPMCLETGDVVLIPDLEPQILRLATNKIHTIEIQRPKRYFSTQLLGSENKPLSNIKYEFAMGEETIAGQTDSEGRIEEPMPVDCQSATLSIWPNPGDDRIKKTLPVQIGALDPTDTVTGMQQRLKNLGKYQGKVDGIFGPMTNSALNRTLDELVKPETEELHST